MRQPYALRPRARSRSRSSKPSKSPKSSSPSSSRRSTSTSQLPSPLEPIRDLAARVRRSKTAKPPPAASPFFLSKDATYSTKRPSFHEAESEEYNLLRLSAFASGSLAVVLLFGLLVYMALWMPKRPAALPGSEAEAMTCNVVSPQQLEVVTTSGKAYGQLGTIADDSSNTTRGVLRHFFGLPYGMAPTGPRRFAVATASSYFLPDGSWHSEAHGPPCPQNGPLYEESAEDCLTLSIWAPFVCNSSESLKPAVVAVAGQWLQTGDIRERADYWQKLAYRGDMVVVSVNHRLGVMGFFSGDTIDAPGNVGIYDLLLALSWIHSNVAAFHGDPDKLVALGYGSGAFLLSLDLIARNVSRRFFRRLVLHGLSVDTIFPRNDGSTGVNLMQTAMPCPASDGQASSVTSCLRSKSSKEILDVVNLTLPLRFVPSRYSPPLNFLPYTDLSARLSPLEGVDILIGYSELEGSILFDDYLIPSLMLNDSMPTSDVYERCLLFYSQWTRQPYKNLEASVHKSLERANFQGFREYFTYLTAACPTAELARAASAKGATVYHYASLKTQDYFMEPVLSMGEMIAFAKTGKVKWTPYSSDETTLVVDGDSRTEEHRWRSSECKSVLNIIGS